MRRNLADFNLNNPFYAGLQVTAWLVDPNSFEATDYKATLYADLSGPRTLPNPITLDSNGKWPIPPYSDQSVILEIQGNSYPAHQTGVIPRLGYARGSWATDTEYWPGDTVTHGDAGDVYQCQVVHVSDVFATDLTEVRWILMVDAAGIEQNVVDQLISEGVGLPEAPEDGVPYSRKDAAWTQAPTKAEVVALQNAVGQLSGGVVYVGNYDATAHTTDYTPASGIPDGVLVAASTVPGNYVIVTVAGTGASPAPVIALSVGDYLISDGTVWNHVPLGGGTTAASAVSFTPTGTVSSTNVQDAIAEVSGDVTTEANARTTAISTEATARATADTTEQTARIAADNALSTAITNAITTAETYTDDQIDAFDAPNTANVTYGRNQNTWVEVVRRRFRKVTGTSDTPTLANDKDGIIVFASNSAITLTANDLGEGVSYSIQQWGNGQITVAAGVGVTRISNKASPSYQSARRGSIMQIMCDGAGNVFVTGDTA